MNKSNSKNTRLKKMALSNFHSGRISLQNNIDLYVQIGSPEKAREDNLTVVFIHGNDVDHTIWKCQEEYFLKAGCRTISYDLRGFGQSSRPEGSMSPQVHQRDLELLLNKLKSTNVVLVGWSLGGLIAQAFTIKHSENVHALILIGTTPSMCRREDFPYGKTQFQDTQLEADFKTYVSKESEAIVPTKLSGKSAHLLRNYIASLIRQTGHSMALRQIKDASDFNSIQDLNKLYMRTLIIFGTDDEVINHGASLFMRALIPNARIFEFQDAGHAPFLTSKEKFNLILSRFLFDETVPTSDFCRELLELAPQ